MLLPNFTFDVLFTQQIKNSNKTIFQCCLDRYYSMIFIRCYYLVSLFWVLGIFWICNFVSMFFRPKTSKTVFFKKKKIYFKLFLGTSIFQNSCADCFNFYIFDSYWQCASSMLLGVGGFWLQPNSTFVTSQHMHFEIEWKYYYPKYGWLDQENSLIENIWHWHWHHKCQLFNPLS